MPKKPSPARAAAAKVGQFVSIKPARQMVSIVASGATGVGPKDKPLPEKKSAIRPRKVSVQALRRSSAVGREDPLTQGFLFSLEPLMRSVQERAHLPQKTLRALKADFREVLERSAREARAPQANAGVVPEGDEVLSTQQAADLVGVSRPFMAARIDAGEIPLFQQVGNQRRVLASSVRAWHEQSRQRSRQALVQLSQSIDDEYSDED